MRDAEWVARLDAVSQNLEGITHNVADLLRSAPARRQDADGLRASDLRTVGHRLVSLAGELTTLGVDTARWADDLDEGIDTEA